MFHNQKSNKKGEKHARFQENQHLHRSIKGKYEGWNKDKKSYWN